MCIKNAGYYAEDKKGNKPETWTKIMETKGQTNTKRNQNENYRTNLVAYREQKEWLM